MGRTRRTDVIVGWCQKLTIVGLVAVSAFVARANAQAPDQAAAALQQRSIDRLVQEEVRAHERLNSLLARVENLEGLKADSRLIVLEQAWLVARERDAAQMTMLYSIVGGLVVLALGQFLNLRESSKHRRGRARDQEDI